MTLDWLNVFMRWVHIGCATLAIGVPIFMRFVLMPAAKEALDDAAHAKLRERMMATWRKWVYTLITLFIISGLYTFLVAHRWKNMDQDNQGVYQMIFGIKVLAAFGIFFLASALAGRSQALAVIRKNQKFWLNINIALAVVVILCGGVLRFIPENKISVSNDVNSAGEDLKSSLHSLENAGKKEANQILNN